jgi:hypothetical protein
MAAILKVSTIHDLDFSKKRSEIAVFSGARIAARWYHVPLHQ